MLNLALLGLSASTVLFDAETNVMAVVVPRAGETCWIAPDVLTKIDIGLSMLSPYAKDPSLSLDLTWFVIASNVADVGASDENQISTMLPVGSATMSLPATSSRY